MRNLHYIVCVAALAVVASLAPGSASAQQDPMFTKYMFNSVGFNPAYAGTKEYLSATAIVRDQWLSWSKGSESYGGGAPVTYVATVHSPFQERVGLGGYLGQDHIGSSTFTELNAFYAYKMPLSDEMTLSLGLQGGVTHHSYDFSGLHFRENPALDPSFQNQDGQSWMPNAGAGAYFYTDKFYFGASVPRMFETRLQEVEIIETSTPGIGRARNYRHMYVATGGAIPLGSKDLVFKPSLLVKGVGWLGDFAASSQSVDVVRTPTEFDIDVSLLIRQVLWIGGSFRSTFDYIFEGKSSHDSADLWAAFYLDNGLRIGLAYDYSLTELQQFGNGSAELMIGYDLNFSVDKIVTPRYF